MMSMSESESLSQKMKQEYLEEKIEAFKMKRDSKDKEEELLQVSEEEKQQKEEQRRHSASESSRSITFHSPATPPFTRTQIPPSPALHSLDDLPISSDNFHSSATEHHKPPVHFHSVSDGILPVVVANQFQVAGEKTVTAVGPNKVEEGIGGGNSNGGYDFLKKKKEVNLNMALLGLRIAAFVLCLKSFAILAADRQVLRVQIWLVKEKVLPASFIRYKEFKYCLSINVIAFVYSGVQICDLVKYLITKKHTVGPRFRGFFNFAMDQILTYLLMSASSSAATLASYSESELGRQRFVVMVHASVTSSYIAFVAFALTSLVSGYILSRV